ncbi:MAG: hypothetical protein KIT17_16110 [Rubrivivax sp.]|nr:hypothetical protein [Rubrivivax sp.]
MTTAAVLCAAGAAAQAGLGGPPATATPSATPSSRGADADAIQRAVEATLQEIRRFQLELRPAVQASAATLLPGQPGEVQVDLDLAGVPAGFDVYALVFAAQDDCLVVERVSKQVAPARSTLRSLDMKVGKLSANEYGTLLDENRRPLVKIAYVRLADLAFTLSGPPGSGALSTLQVSPRSHPMHFGIPFETLAQAFMAMMQPDSDGKEALDRLKVDNEDFPVMLNFAYLASASGRARETLSGLALGLTPPRSRFFYNGVALLPVLVKRFADGLVVLRLDEARANRLVLAAAAPAGTSRGPCGDAPTPPRPQPAGPPLQEDIGRLTLSVRGAPVLRIGREVSVEFAVEHADLKRDTEIYVLLQAAHGERVISEAQGLRAESSAGNARYRACTDPKPETGDFRIRDDPIVIDVPLMLGRRLEAGKLASVHQGGSGHARGRVTFTPPPFNRYYDRVRATPLALTWSNDGRLCTVLDSSPGRSVEMRLEGR